MSVLTLPVQPGHETGRPAVPWQRMAWVTWRQHRAMLTGVTALLAAVSVFLLIEGLKIRSDYTAMINCRSACQPLDNQFGSTDWTLANTLGIFMLLAPALLGAFTGPAVLAREIETGTFRYAWTQGIGRVRWTVAKLVLLAVALAIVTGAFSQLFAWFFDPFLGNSVGFTDLSATVFTTRGIDFAAWTVLAFAIGAFFGMLIRRLIPAMVATLIAYLGVNLLAWLVLREDYPVAITTSGTVANTTGAAKSLGTPAAYTPNAPWILRSWVTGGTHWTRYIPVSRFWPMQFIEAGWLLVLAIALGAATVWLVRRRAA
jgi:hypothetical protein